MQLLLWNAVCYFLVVTEMDTPKSEIRWETGTKALWLLAVRFRFFVRVEQYADMGSSLPADFCFWSIHSSHDRYFLASCKVSDEFQDDSSKMAE